MREIKFRAWDKETKRMFNVAKLDISYDYQNNVILMQHTGLHDKNGVKVYDGDILSAHLDSIFPQNETIAQVLWHEYGWYIKEHDSVDFTPIDSSDDGLWEVVGNIYENPELLEE